MRPFNIVFVKCLLVIAFRLSNVVCNEAICTIIVSSRQSRFVPYLETYRRRTWRIFHQLSTRMNYKIDYYTAYRLEETCCNGYRSIPSEDSRVYHCEPVCTKKCVNGKCIKPDTCECFEHYVQTIDPESGETVCSPFCQNACIHGKCVQPYVCECEAGYFLDSDGFTCLPYCKEKCEELHAFCSVPDVCTCKLGYEETRTNGTLVCKPICERPCVLGECTAPNRCICKSGYELSSKDVFTCIPICNETCVFGSCTAPDTCTCDDGYKAINSSACTPICSEPCSMGTCIAPEVCSCFDGYGLLDSSKYVCEPICEKPCVNANCTAPNTCTCHSGFSLSENETAVCNPDCDIPCEPFGRCVAPNHCMCQEGYQFVDTSQASNDVALYTAGPSTSRCEPICDPPCVNGTCTKPGVCTCHRGFQQANTSKSGFANVCQLVCQPPCKPNSECSRPNVCTCKQGYKTVWRRDVTFTCEPICERKCNNGKCVSPNVCTCDEGYIKNGTKDACVPVCQTPCTNGVCIEPNVCRCDEGYISRNKSICEPFCTSACRNGKCTAPNVCECHEGFVKLANSTAAGCVDRCTVANCSGNGVCLNAGQGCDCSFGWTGSKCEESTMCIVMLDDETYKNFEGVTILNKTNISVYKIYKDAPHCRKCIHSVDNTSLCFNVFDNSNKTGIACFVNTSLACYAQLEYKPLSDISTMTGSLAAIIGIILVGISAVYFVFRKRKGRSVKPTDNVQASLLPEPPVTEALIPEEDEYI